MNTAQTGSNLTVPETSISGILATPPSPSEPHTDHNVIKVKLMATVGVVKSRFPDEYAICNPQGKGGIISADFQFALDECQTKLGRWLAQNIKSTRYDDDASRCFIVAPATESGLHVRELGSQLMNKSEIRTLEDFVQVLQRLEEWIGEQRSHARLAGNFYFAYRVFPFDWPVFGSRRSNYAPSPAAYFDECAKQIRATGGVVVGAGLSRATPPESLLRTMGPATHSGQKSLYERYQESLAERRWVS